MSQNHPLLTAAPPCPAKDRRCTTNFTLLPTLTTTWYAYTFSLQLVLFIIVSPFFKLPERRVVGWDSTRKVKRVTVDISLILLNRAWKGMEMDEWVKHRQVYFQEAIIV